ncbi:MAG: hypothetical protein MUO58_06915, partial [Anaerolineales bacterium]|nr:hypothetical protein [Anaerolineales bacterium]
YIDPSFVGGHHLVYLPKYIAPGSPWASKSDEEIRAHWLEALVKMFPEFDRSWVQEIRIHRERYVEPLHGLGQVDLIPGVETPIQNFYVATTAQIYPDLTNGESVTHFARKVSPQIVSLAPAYPASTPKQVVEDEFEQQKEYE